LREGVLKDVLEFGLWTVSRYEIEAVENVQVLVDAPWRAGLGIGARHPVRPEQSPDDTCHPEGCLFALAELVDPGHEEALDGVR
jgi:hypothetical protein